MRKRWWMIVAPPAFLAFIALGGLVVMWLWNWLLPPLFGWHQVTFWQAIGLLALCRILFGGFGGHRSHDHHFGRRFGRRWQAMTPEEKERFRQEMRARCGGSPASSEGGATAAP